MGLQVRGNGIYYYRFVRKGGRGKTVYCGSGALALLMAEEAAARRAARRAELRELRALKEDDGLLERDLGGLARAAQAAARAALEQAGCHKYQGMWRRRRVDRDRDRG